MHHGRSHDNRWGKHEDVHHRHGHHEYPGGKEFPMPEETPLGAEGGARHAWDMAEQAGRIETPAGLEEEETVGVHPGGPERGEAEPEALPEGAPRPSPLRTRSVF